MADKVKRPKWRIDWWKATWHMPQAVGGNPFPLDMLRYDHTFVHPGTVIRKQDGPYQWWESVDGLSEVLVAVVTGRGKDPEPRHARWHSFGWQLSRMKDQGPVPDNWITMTIKGPGGDDLEPREFRELEK